MAWYNPRDWFRQPEPTWRVVKPPTPAPEGAIKPGTTGTGGETPQQYADRVTSTPKSGTPADMARAVNTGYGGGGGSSRSSSGPTSSMGIQTAQPQPTPTGVEVLTGPNQSTSTSTLFKRPSTVSKITQEYNPAIKTTETTLQQSESPSAITRGTTGTGGGLVYVTPEEASKYRGTLPLWAVQSPNTPAGMLDAIDIESKWASGVNVMDYSSGFSLGKSEELPKGVYEYNQADIKRVQEGAGVELGYKQAERGFLKEVKATQVAFESDPGSFSGKEGFSEIKTDTGIEYSLAPSYFTTLPSYSNLLTAEQGIKDFSGKFDDETGLLKSSEYKSYLGEARADWQGLPEDVQARSRLSSIQLGVRKALTGMAEGTINFGLIAFKGLKQTDKDSSFQYNDRFSFGTDYMELPGEYKGTKFLSSPTGYTKELIIERPTTLAQGYTYAIPVIKAVGGLASQTYQTAKIYGIQTALTQGLSYFSPLRIDSNQMYSFDPSKQTYDARMKITLKDGGVVTRTTTGVGDIGGSSIGGGLRFPRTTFTSTETFVQTSTGNMAFGGGRTTITNPFTTYVGGKFFTGTTTATSQTVGFASSLQGTQGYMRYGFAKDFTGLDIRTGQGVGVKADTYYAIMKTTTTYNLPGGTKTFINIPTQSGFWSGSKSAGTVKDISQTEFTFKGGERITNYGFTRTETGFTYAPESIGFKTKISGTGKIIDLRTPIISSVKPDFMAYDVSGKPSGSIFGGRTLGYQPQALDTSFGTSISTYGPTTIQTQPPQPSFLTGLKSPSLSFVSPQSLVGYATTLPITTSIFDIRADTGIKQKDLTELKVRTLTGLKNYVNIKPDIAEPGVRFYDGARTGPTQSPRLDEVLIQPTDQATKFKVPVSPTFRFPSYTGGGFIIGLPPFPLGGLGSPTTRTYRGKRTFKYTPSYEALVFNIKGKAPKGIETGARIRPITTGFSFGRSLGNLGGLGNFTRLGNFNINPFRTKKARKGRSKKK